MATGFMLQASRRPAQPAACSLQRAAGCYGQSMLEVAVLVGAVATALVLMSGYIGRAMNAHSGALEEELNGAVEENRP